MVVKNVSGYDMMKLYVGSLGTLAVVVDLNFKLAPRPSPSAQRGARVRRPRARRSRPPNRCSPCQLLPGAVACSTAPSPRPGLAPAGRRRALARSGSRARAGALRRAVRDRLRSAATGLGRGEARAPAADAAAMRFWDRLLAFQTLDAEPHNSGAAEAQRAADGSAAVMAGVAEVGAQVDLRCLQ